MVVSSRLRPARMVGHGQGMGDVGLARLAQLALVGPFGHVEGPDDHGGLALRVALPEGGEQRGEGLDLLAALAAPRQDPLDGRGGHGPSTGSMVARERSRLMGPVLATHS